MKYSVSGLQPGFRFDVRSDPNSGVFSFTALTAGASLPEPGTPALLGLAGLAAWAVRRRQGQGRLASADRQPPHSGG